MGPIWGTYLFSNKMQICFLRLFSRQKNALGELCSSCLLFHLAIWFFSPCIVLTLQVTIYAQRRYLLTPLTSSWASTWSTPLGSGAPNINKKDMGLLEQGQRRAWRCSQVCNTSPLQPGWESWDWRRKGSKETLQHLPAPEGGLQESWREVVYEDM